MRARHSLCPSPSLSPFALMASLVAWVALFAAPGAGAQSTHSSAAWTDPTRPGAVAAAPASADGASSAPKGPKAAASAPPPPAAPQLQSLQIGRNGEASALIDGRLLQVGDSLGALRVVAIDVDGVTLRDAKGRSERMNLIHAAIVKRDGGSERPMAAISDRLNGGQGRRP